MKSIVWLMAIVLIAGSIFSASYEYGVKKTSDAYIRDRVVMLIGNQGGCSGIEITAPSKAHYILSARHCVKISSDGIFKAKLESGAIKIVQIVAVDKDADLLLLSSADNKSIAIADKVKTHEHIHTLTHGAMQPTYRTDGEMLKSETVDVLMGMVMSEDDAKACEAVPNQKIVADLFGNYCVITLTLNTITAWVMGGSSGGPVLNDKGELVGIVSASGGAFLSSMVTLEDIHRFLSDK